MQSRVLPDHSQEFELWQRRLNDVVAVFDGFIDQASIRPSPPAQLDWVIIHRFRSAEAARAWMQSPERQKLASEIEPALVGALDVHLFNDSDPRLPAAPVSAIISTRVSPGQEKAFTEWQRHIAAVEAKFEGYQGYKLEPPIPGVQEDWVMVVRFDSDAHLDAWLNSEERRRLLEESTPFDEATRIRKVQSGFESWFVSKDDTGPPPPVWKQSMIVLLVLYPVVFLWGFFIGTPFLGPKGLSLPFWLALFIGNAVSVSLTGFWLIAWGSRLLGWWLSPAKDAPHWRGLAGTALVLLLYCSSMLVFALFPIALRSP
ncbi:MAG TPA: antibiotic biosynthesis monooxygenase [Dehalococcoidia bacterium]|nr:antibiotic biosynthesis monooxygenase [Dehalococcoidia bacterium]